MRRIKSGAIAAARCAAMLAAGMKTQAKRRRLQAAALLVLAAVWTPSLAAATSATSAEPPEVATVFRAFALFGRWAVDCRQPASPANPHVEVVATSPGLVMETHDLGPGALQNRYSVLSASRLSASKVAVTAIFQPGTAFEERQQLEMVVGAETRQTTFNQPKGQPVRVKGGIAVDFGIRTPVLRKCE